MNVPNLHYDPIGDPLQFSKSPNRFRNNHFSPNESRGRDRNAGFNNSTVSPAGRNMGGNFNTINNSHSNMHSIEMTSPMSRINK